MLLFCTAVWGVTFVVVKDSLAFADPFTFLALRFALGFLGCAVVARGALKDGAAWRGGAWLGLALFVGYALQTAGLVHTTPSRSAFITGLTVVLVPFIARLVLGRRPPLDAWVGAALATGGLWLLTGGAAAGGPTLLGDLLTLGCTVSFAFHIVLTEKFAGTAAPTALVATQVLAVAVGSAALLPLAGARLEPSPTLWWGIGVTGLVATSLAISLQTWAQARTPAVRAALLFALEPVFAAGLSVALGREVLGWLEVAGGGLIVLGVVAGELRVLPGARRVS